VTVTFSAEVRITSYDETVLPTKDPSSRSDTFRFSGGQLENGARFSISWTPSTAEITSTEWETTGAATGSASHSAPLTYDQIMAQIAQYPGPDEPLYVPAEGEDFWLTDLEGHADIYDNDSIKINYAPGFDRSQITRIDVYRNGVKLRFVPALFDVLTNDQMKTFDGNPAENTPASSHTDHAIWGYEYSFRLFTATASSPIKVAIAAIRAPIAFDADYAMANIGHTWFYALEEGCDASCIQTFLQGVRAAGFRGIQVNVSLFMESARADTLVPIYENDPARVPAWVRTVRDEQLVTLLALARESALDVEVRLEYWLTQDYIASHPDADRMKIAPASISAWFDNYSTWAGHYAQLAEDGGARYFCPMVEASSMEQHTAEVRQLLATVREVFSGEILVAEATNAFLFGWYPGWHMGQFWDADQTIIGMNMWGVPLETQSDQRFSRMVEAGVAFWLPAVSQYRTVYPGHRIVFSEAGFYNYDGGALGGFDQGKSVDCQETADYWASVMTTALALGLDGVSVWNYSLYAPMLHPGSTHLNVAQLMSPIRAVLRQ
jgi:hypothetical protein